MFVFCSIMVHTQKPGWHCRGYLPHFDANTLVQHVVFRTSGSLSASVLENVRTLDSLNARQAIDDELDNSKNGIVFANTELANFMLNGLKHFDGDRYDLQAWCIMPNHVHVMLVTAPDILLGQIVKTWKSQATRQINFCLGSTGEVFARDYFDRFMRNSAQVNRTIAYIENNPVKAALCNRPEDWIWSSSAARLQGWQPSHKRMPLFID